MRAEPAATRTVESQFAFLDRFDRVQSIGVSATPSFGSPGSYYATLFEAHAQLLDASTGIGAYAQLPVSQDAARFPLSQRGTSSGNLDAGVGYLAELDGTSTIVVRVGSSIPVSSSTNSESAYISRYARPSDAVEFIDRGYWVVRAASSWISRHGPLFARVDAGFDVPLGRSRSSLLSHVGAGGGYAFSRVTLTAELSTLQGTASVGDADSTHSLGPGDYPGMIFLGCAGFLRAGPVRPYLGVLAYAGSLGDTFGSAFKPSFFITAGFDVVIPSLR